MAGGAEVVDGLLKFVVVGSIVQGKRSLAITPISLLICVNKDLSTAHCSDLPIWDWEGTFRGLTQVY